MKRMRTPVLAIVVVSLCVFSAIGASGKNEIPELKELISLLQERIELVELRLSKLEPPKGKLGLPQQLDGKLDVLRKPGPIRSTGKAVTDKTQLTVGEILQAEWGNQWWATLV